MLYKLALFTLLFLICGLLNASAQTPTPTPEQSKAKVEGTLILGDSSPAYSKGKTSDILKEGKISKGVINGSAVSLPKPAYPAAAKAVKASGAVNVHVLIDESGNVEKAEAVTGHPLLRQVAEQAALLSKFKPTTLEGQPVTVSGVIVYNFVLPPNAATEGKNVIFGIGALLNVLQNIEQEIMNKLGAEEGLNASLLKMSNVFPAEFATEKELFRKLAAAKGAERRQVASELIASIKQRLSGPGLIEYEVGQSFGTTVVEMLKLVQSLDTGKVGDEGQNLRLSLQKLQSQLNALPPGMTPDAIESLKKVAAFADIPQITSPETIENMLNAIEPIFDIFDKEK